MNIIIKKNINKSDWKSFKKWANDSAFLFNDINLYSGFFSINNESIEDYLIDFYIYNHFVLEDRYDFDWPDYLLNIKTNDIEEFINNLFLYFFKDEYKYFKSLIPIFKNIQKYKVSEEIDYEKEFSLLEEYWDFIEIIRNRKYPNYNEWITYINSKIYTKRKGLK